MEFGVPKETRDMERRVGLTPAGAMTLVQTGNTVHVETGAGLGAGFDDEQYRLAGAQIVYSAAEAYGRADAVLKVARPTAAEHRLFRHGQTIMSFMHLAVSSPDLLEALQAHEITAVAYETIQDETGNQPILLPMSEIAGRLAPILAGQLLLSHQGGRGTLLSGIPGIPAAAVVILGAGTLGINAARAFLGLEAQVTVVDQRIDRLRLVEDLLGGRITTRLTGEFALKRVTEFADVLVGCVHTAGRRAPILVTREMVRNMRPGAVVIDFAIDQGGCLETSRPTTLRTPTYVEEGVIHHCVPNVTSLVARTTSYALTNAIMPYLIAISRNGLLGALGRERSLLPGVSLYQGKLAQPAVASALGRELEVDLAGGATT